MKKRKLKKSVIKKGILILSIIILIITTIKVISTVKYHKTDEYKLKKIWYKIEEIKTIETISKENIEYKQKSEYNELIEDNIKEKYYIDKKQER